MCLIFQDAEEGELQVGAQPMALLTQYLRIIHKKGVEMYIKAPRLHSSNTSRKLQA